MDFFHDGVFLMVLYPSSCIDHISRPGLDSGMLRANYCHIGAFARSTYNLSIGGRLQLQYLCCCSNDK
jgi:hypothetical protein